MQRCILGKKNQITVISGILIVIISFVIDGLDLDGNGLIFNLAT